MPYMDNPASFRSSLPLSERYGVYHFGTGADNGFSGPGYGGGFQAGITNLARALLMRPDASKQDTEKMHADYYRALTAKAQSDADSAGQALASKGRIASLFQSIPQQQAIVAAPADPGNSDEGQAGIDSTLATRAEQDRGRVAARAALGQIPAQLASEAVYLPAGSESRVPAAYRFAVANETNPDGTPAFPDSALARAVIGSGQTIGKDQAVSLQDRDAVAQRDSTNVIALEQSKPLTTAAAATATLNPSDPRAAVSGPTIYGTPTESTVKGGILRALTPEDQRTAVLPAGAADSYSPQPVIGTDGKPVVGGFNRRTGVTTVPENPQAAYERPPAGNSKPTGADAANAAFMGQDGKKMADAMDQLRSTATGSSSALGALDRVDAMIKNGQVQTGKLANFKSNLEAWASGFGIKGAYSQANSLPAFNAESAGLVMGLIPQLHTRLTNQELVFLQQMKTNPSITPEANLKLSAIQRRVYQQVITDYGEARKFIAANKGPVAADGTDVFTHLYGERAAGPAPGTAESGQPAPAVGRPAPAGAGRNIGDMTKEDLVALDPSKMSTDQLARASARLRALNGAQ